MGNKTEIAGLDDAIAEIRARLPVNLDAALEHRSAKTGEVALLTFSDDHEFSIALPAWVLRVLKRYKPPGTKK